jgi:hypothetical protein
LVFQLFLLLYTNVLLKNSLIARHGFVFPYLWMCVFVALTSSTRLEC